MSRLQAWVLIAIAAVAVGALVQMNRYEYLQQRDDIILRIDRLTGQQCIAATRVSKRTESSRQRFLERINVPPC